MPYQKIRSAIWHNPGRYALLAGAGVSQSSGVPLAGEIVTMIATEEFRLENFRPPYSREELDAWRAAQVPPIATYQDAIEHLGEHPEDHADFVRKLVAGTAPSKGHWCLADLVAFGWFQYIFTTNFDRLIEQALMQRGLDPCILMPNMTCRTHEADLPIVVKLHGDCKFSNIRNLKVQTRKLDNVVCVAFDKSLACRGLVVVGYGGNDDSVMRPLERVLRGTRNSAVGVYWLHVSSEEIHPRLRDLERSGNHDEHRFTFVRCESSDEFFADLWSHFLGRDNGTSGFASKSPPNLGPGPTAFFHPPSGEAPGPGGAPAEPGKSPGGGLNGGAAGSRALQQRLRQKVQDEFFGEESPVSVTDPLLGPFKVLCDAVGEEKALQELKKLQEDPGRLADLSGEGWNDAVVEQLRKAIQEPEDRLRRLQSALKDREKPPKWFEKWLPFLRRRKPPRQEN